MKQGEGKIYGSAMVWGALAIGAYVIIFLAFMFLGTTLEITRDIFSLSLKAWKFLEQNPVIAITGAAALALLLKKLCEIGKTGIFKKPYFPIIVFVIIILSVQFLAAFLVLRSAR